MDEEMQKDFIEGNAECKLDMFQEVVSWNEVFKLRIQELSAELDDSRKAEAFAQTVIEASKKDAETIRELRLQLDSANAAVSVNLRAAKEQAEKVKTLRESITALLETEMGEWYAVSYPYLPQSVSGLGLIRAALEATK